MTPVLQNPSTPSMRTRASSSSNSGTPSPPPRHKWTIEERVTLAILAGYYQMNWSDVVRLLHRCHMTNMRARKRLSERSIIAQWFWMRPFFTEQDAFRELDSASPPYGSEKSKLISQALLEKKARSMGIKLIVRVHKSQTLTIIQQKSPTTIKRKLSMLGPYFGAVDDNPDSNPSAAETDFLPRTPKKQCQVFVSSTPANRAIRSPENGMLTPASTLQSTQAHFIAQTRRLPQIAFRTFSQDSQGINSANGFCTYFSEYLFPIRCYF